MNAVIDISNVILKTDRLILREFNQDDLSDLFEYASVEGVGEKAGWKHHENKEESKRILDMFIEEKKTFAITLNNKVIGSIGIEIYDEELWPELKDKKVREIGFVLSKDYWGKGIIKEAVDKVIDYCFNSLNLDALVCSHFIDNNQSSRVQDKIGFIKTDKVVTKYIRQLGIDKEIVCRIMYKN